MDNIIKPGKAVFFTYVVTDTAGQVMEQSDIPLGYIHGSQGSLLPKLEQELEKHRVGDRVEVNISPDEGFGELDKNLFYTDKIENVPADFRFVGAQAEFKNEHGEKRTFTVTKIEDGKVTLDGNHPYAGKTIVFIVTIQEIRDADQEEIESGRAKNAPPPILH